ncbi:4007_t:CDS:2 [Gigaspora rosea]|nr:4007_t:CDS:2 [Gigaspora rosea]
MGRIPNSAVEKVGWKDSENTQEGSFEPSKEELAYLKERLDQTWENIEAAIIAAARKSVPYAKMRKSEEKKQHKMVTIKAAIALVRRINHLAEIQINNVPHTGEELEDWLTEAYT